MLANHPEHAHLRWLPMSTAPMDGTTVLIRGKSFPRTDIDYFLSGPAAWKATSTVHPAESLLCSWVTPDGKYGWHAEAWHPCLEQSN